MKLYNGIIVKTVDIAKLIILWPVATVLKYYEVYSKGLFRESF